MNKLLTVIKYPGAFYKEKLQKNEKIMNAGNGINTGISQKKQKKYNNC